jgi:hypothetical protein
MFCEISRSSVMKRAPARSRLQDRLVIDQAVEELPGDRVVAIEAKRAKGLAAVRRRWRATAGRLRRAPRGPHSRAQAA